MAGFHQAVAQGAERVGLAGAGQSEGQHVDAALDEAALGADGQVAAAAPGGLGRARRFPRSCPRVAWTPAQPADAPVTPILEYLQESCQGIAVAGRGETSHRLGAHGGQLELAAQLADASRWCPSCAHPRRGQADREQAVVDLQVASRTESAAELRAPWARPGPAPRRSRRADRPPAATTARCPPWLPWCSPPGAGSATPRRHAPRATAAARRRSAGSAWWETAAPGSGSGQRRRACAPATQ